MYAYYLANFADLMMFIIAVYFGFICIFGDRQDRKHSVILCFASSLACIGMYNSVAHDVVLTPHEYSVSLIVSALWDGLTATALSMCMLHDRKAAYQALTLCLILPITAGMVYELEVGLVTSRGLIYTYYTELLISIGAIQIAISYDGFIIAFGNASERCKRISSIFAGVCSGDTSSNARKG